MSVSNNSGNTSVTGSVTSTAQKNTVTAKYVKTTGGAGAQTIYTVGVGKKARLIGVHMISNCNNTNVNVDFKMTIATVDMFYLLYSNNAGYSNFGTTDFNGSYADAIPLVAGDTVTCTLVGANSYGMAHIQYIEENV